MVKPDHNTDEDIGFLATGGLSIGLNRWCSPTDRAPLTTLSIYRNRTVITRKFPRRRYELARGDITKIAVERTLWIFRSVRIFHNRSDYPPYISFGSFMTDEILEGFRRVGYPVESD